MRKTLLIAVMLLACLCMGAKTALRLRPPSAVGAWYPADRDKLRSVVQGFLNNAPAPSLPEGKVVALVVPHGEYGLSGDIAGQAVKTVKTGQYDRIIIFTPSHYASFRGCSIPSVDGFKTPVGDVPLDLPVIDRISRCTLISTRALKYRTVQDQPGRPLVHEREFGVEVLLPFLQEQVGLFWMVPMVTGDFLTHDGKLDIDGLDAIAHVLRNEIDDRTLLIVSSNLTHHGNMYSYRPFKDNVVEQVEKLDQQAIELIINKDLAGFSAFLNESRDPICGKNALALLFRLLPPTARGSLIAYDNSTRRTKNANDCVGYAAIAFTDPAQDPPAEHPENALPMPQAPPPEPSKAAEMPKPPSPEKEKKSEKKDSKDKEKAKKAEAENKANKPAKEETPEEPASQQKR